MNSCTSSRQKVWSTDKSAIFEVEGKQMVKKIKDTSSLINSKQSKKAKIDLNHQDQNQSPSANSRSNHHFSNNNNHQHHQQHQQHQQQQQQTNYLSNNYNFQQPPAPTNGINIFQQQNLASMSLASNKVQNNHLNYVNPQTILPLANTTNIGLSAIMNHNHANFLTNES